MTNNQKNRVKILLADDHIMLLEGIRLYLEVKDYEVIGIVQNGSELLTHLEKELPQVVIIDINMAETNGLKTLRQIKVLYPDLKVIVLSMYQSSVFVQEAIDAGADGYVFKSRAGKELLSAIELVVNDELFFSEQEKSEEAKGTETSPPETEWNIIQKLTKREKEILILLTQDLSTKQIAGQLFSSPHTIETHRRNLLKKIGVQSVNGLVNFAVRNSIFLKEN